MTGQPVKSGATRVLFVKVFLSLAAKEGSYKAILVTKLKDNNNTPTTLSKLSMAMDSILGARLQFSRQTREPPCMSLIVRR